MVVRIGINPWRKFIKFIHFAFTGVTVASVLRGLEAAVDTLAFGIIGQIPTCFTDSQIAGINSISQLFADLEPFVNEINIVSVTQFLTGAGPLKTVVQGLTNITTSINAYVNALPYPPQPCSDDVCAQILGLKAQKDATYANLVIAFDGI